MFVMYYLQLLIFTVYHLLGVCGYNVDTNFPKIYNNPLPNEHRSSYFGYAILLSNSWVLVGAPRANSSLSGREPGVTLLCEFNSTCKELSVGKNIMESKFSFSSGAWFGSAMDKREMTNEVVVCAHRWMNDSFPNIIPGACVSFHPSQDLKNITNLLMPTASTDLDMRNLKQGNSYIAYRYAMSQSGASVHFTEEGEQGNLLLGAPGSINWKGTIVKCSDLTSCTRKPTVLDVYNYAVFEDFAYFGYGLSSGRFFSKEIFYVAGAPRDNSMKGFVLIFQSNIQSKFWHTEKIYGKMIGEYYGSSIAVADISGDGLDDLIVGAPFFSKNGDEGRIHIVQFNQKKEIKNQYDIIGKKEGGRFGSAVAALGDVDRDGYQDIAVGAPYEDNGAVYIYYGRFDSLKEHQKILAGDIYHGLKGFGISFSGKGDVDGNKYNDIAVGSFLSGHVVIFRTRPVIKIQVQLTSMEKQLPFNATRITITSCLSYSGKDAPKELSFIRKLYADTSNERLYPRYKENVVNLTLGLDYCVEDSFRISFKMEKSHRSLDFYLTAELLKSNVTKETILVHRNGTISGNDRFHLLSPLENKKDETFFHSLEIPFTHGCKNTICQPDLQVLATLLEDEEPFNLSNPFLVGSMAQYQLKIEVRNIGEASYQTQVAVRFPNATHVNHVPHTCYLKEYILTCQQGLIMRDQTIRPIILDLDMSATENLNFMDVRELQVNFDIFVNSAGNDINRANNYQNITLNLILDVDGYISAKSQKDVYPVERHENGSFSSVVEVIHVYEIHKKGVSALRSLEFTLKVPVEMQHRGKKIVFKESLKLVFDRTYWACYDEQGFAFSHHFNTEVIEDVDPRESHSRRRRSVDTLFDEKSPPLNRTLFINCSSSDVKCVLFTCRSIEVLPYGTIYLIVNINIEKLVPAMGQKDIVFLTSQGNISILKPLLTSENSISHKWAHDADASSLIIGKIPKKKVELWVIISSAVGGVLLLMIIAMGLAKAGFFQRKTKEDLKELKEQTRKSQLPTNLHLDQEEEQEINNSFELI